MKKKFKTTAAFPDPNFTQVPNRFFDMLTEDMEASEARVTLVMIRQTFGFHRDTFKMGLGKLAGAAGISRNSAKDGAEAAEKRGTFCRTNPDEQGEAEWTLVVNDCIPPMQPLTPPHATIDSQVGVKESIKKIKEKTLTAKTPIPVEITLFREVTRLYPPKANWDDVVKIIQSVSDRLLRPVTAADLLPFFQAWTFRGFKPTNINWTSWAVTGVIPQGKNQPIEISKDGKGINEQGEETLWGVAVSRLVF
jgi:hypothetical protein